MIKVLFVCLGNICRSPMAEGIFRKIVDGEGLHDKIFCDSAGTSNYHIGELPDHRMRHTARQHGIELTHRARQLAKEDFKAFDYVVAMDQSNHMNIIAHEGWNDTYADKLMLMRSHDEVISTDLNVPDPYFGGMEGFQMVYDMLWKTNRRFLNYLIEKHQLK